MTISTAAAQTAGANVAANGKKDSAAELSQNYELFLKLLTTQIQNQDPLNPQDPSQFTQQLVQFSQVEQSIATNKNLESVLSAINSGQPSQAIGYMGKTIETVSEEIPLQDGRAGMAVTFDGSVTAAELQILDAQGKLVRTLPLSTNAGTQSVTWDGRDASGKQLEDGTYGARIAALGKDEKPVGGILRVAGKVTGVDLTSGNPYLMVGDMPVLMGKVTAVR